MSEMAWLVITGIGALGWLAWFIWVTAINERRDKRTREIEKNNLKLNELTFVVAELTKAGQPVPPAIQDRFFAELFKDETK